MQWKEVRYDAVEAEVRCRYGYGILTLGRYALRGG